jgi:hypothetical protein
MKYSVATIVSILIGSALIGAAYMQTRRVEQLHATLSTLNIQQLANRYWECQPQKQAERYQRDAAYCAVVNRAMEARANEMPALQVVQVPRLPERVRSHAFDLMLIERGANSTAGSI